MSKTAQNTLMPPAWQGALYMVLAGLAFAIGNGLTQIIVWGMGFKPQSDAFWQYGIALLISLPFVYKHGAASLKTKHPMTHIIRVVLSAIGVQAFVMSFSYGLPIWKIIALVMTSPFFILIGAKLFLGEKVSIGRWLAVIVGFIGAMILIAPWKNGFALPDLFPVLAALLWGAASLMTKSLTKDEPAENITVWLLLLLTPINAALSFNAGFEVPTGNIIWMLLIGGGVLFLAQYFLTKSYAAADAAFVQPFDDIKLLSNLAVSWYLGNAMPEGTIWLGMALIFAASGFLLWTERDRQVALAS